MTTPNIAVIIGSTRATRFADKPAAWLMDKIKARTDFTAELVDLREFDLPLFDEPASNMWMPSSNPQAVAWQEKIASFDGYIFITAEYSHSITASLKNALDYAAVDWARKPMAAFGYGGLGAARAVEHLRNIAVEQQMVPVRSAVHLGSTAFMKVHPMGENAEMSEVDEILAPAAEAMFDDLSWWAKATKAARDA